MFGYEKTNLLLGYRVLDDKDSELLLDAFELADQTYNPKNKKGKTTLKSGKKTSSKTTSKIVPVGEGKTFVTKGKIQQKDRAEAVPGGDQPDGVDRQRLGDVHQLPLRPRAGGRE